LTGTSEQVESAMTSLARAGTAALTRRQVMLRMLMSEAAEVDVSWLYAESGGSLADLQALQKRGLVRLGESEVWRDPLQGMEFVASEPPVLTADQAAVWECDTEWIRRQPLGNSSNLICCTG
jgi:hypothetical protein